jgi:hypothetical protein
MQILDRPHYSHMGGPTNKPVAKALRSLVDTVTVNRNESRSDRIWIEIAGKLNSLFARAYLNGVCFGMVAGVRSVRYPHIDNIIVFGRFAA